MLEAAVIALVVAIFGLIAFGPAWLDWQDREGDE
jgi:hypothetical protein